MREEAQRSEPVIEGHNHRALRGEVLAVVPREAARAAGKAASIDPHHHRTTIACALRTRPDVQVQAVLTACRLAWRLLGAGRAGCRAGRAAPASGGCRSPG